LSPESATPRLLGEGSINLTTARLLAPHLTPDNHGTVLESARGKRKAEIEQIVAALSPRPDAAPSIRKLPVPTGEPLRTAAAQEAAVTRMPVAVPGNVGDDQG
jgi:hypothetical protein